MTDYFNKVVIFLGLVSLLGCASATKIVGPDGDNHQLVTCDSIKYCYEKAREVCEGNYQIVDNNSETIGSQYAVVTESSILVKCDKESVND